MQAIKLVKARLTLGILNEVIVLEPSYHVLIVTNYFCQLGKVHDGDDSERDEMRVDASTPSGKLPSHGPTGGQR